VLKGWVFPLIGVAFLLGISWVVVWYQGRVIAENWVRSHARTRHWSSWQRRAENWNCRRAARTSGCA
jgi:hypothetical protein